MKIIFVGINFRDGKGGVASVLNEYSYIFPDALFISSTSFEESIIKNLLRCNWFNKMYLLLFYVF